MFKDIRQRDMYGMHNHENKDLQGADQKRLSDCRPTLAYIMAVLSLSANIVARKSALRPMVLSPIVALSVALVILHIIMGRRNM